MNLTQIVRDWFTRRARLKMQRKAADIERRRAVIRAQIAARREKRQAWRPLTGSLKDATTEALRVENQLARM